MAYLHDMMNWENLLSHQRSAKKKRNEDSSIARSAFEQDFDKLIFSYPFRRLQDKTQVFPLPDHDFVHNRLTHSLEVSSVGRSLGKKVGEAIVSGNQTIRNKGITEFDFGAIVAAASLAHDIGNPPFGHSGETAISDFFLKTTTGKQFRELMTDGQWADVSDFEGNAQGFRLLNKNKYGLNLTFSSLAAFTKYPRQSFLNEVDKSRKSQKKYGFFQTEKNTFQELADELGLIDLSNGEKIAWSRHPLAFLVEAADDICYQIIDLEDGCRMDLVSFEQTKELIAPILGKKFSAKKLNKIQGKQEKIGVLRAMAINELIEQCTQVFLDNEREVLQGSFDKALTSLIRSKEILDEISTLSVEKIYRSRAVLEKEAAGFEVLGGLLEAFLPAMHAYCFSKDNCTGRDKSLIRLLPEEVAIEIEKGTKDEYKLTMICLDFISGMTDRYALALYRKIKGISLPSIS